jgi:hypothetical protein
MATKLRGGIIILKSVVFMSLTTLARRFSLKEALRLVKYTLLDDMDHLLLDGKIGVIFMTGPG